MLRTPGGNTPSSSASSTTIAVEAGVSSEGLITTAHPAASAAPSLRISRSIGSFHGMMSAATPTGSGISMSHSDEGGAPTKRPSSARAAPAK